MVTMSLAGLRFALIRLLSLPIPVSRAMPGLGGMSVTELALVVLIIVVAGFTGSDKTCQTYGIITVLFGMRSNFVLRIMGFSFQNMLLWHKALGVGWLVALFIHGFIEGYSPTGAAMGILIGLQLLFYVFIAKLKFDFFYYPHICIYVLIVIFAFLHGASTFAMSAVIIYGAELLLRHVLMQRKAVAAISLLDEQHVRLRVPKTFSYSACQYCFLMVPGVNVAEFHPFSIASAPHEDSVTFIIKVSGDWTQKLAQLVRDGATETIVYVQGPYGGPAVDFGNSDTYKGVLLVCGGVGITAGLSLYKDLVAQGKPTEGQRKVTLLWVTRDIVLPDKVYHDEVLGMAIKGKDVELANKGAVVPANPPEACDAHFHVFVSKKADDADVSASHIPRDLLHAGRPQLQLVFQEMATTVEAQGGGRVAVMVCGPASMVFEVRTMADKTLLDPRCGAVRFDCQEEYFGF